MALEAAIRQGPARAVHAEWTKLRSVRSSAWAVLAIVGLTVLLSALIAASSHTNATQAEQGDDDLVRNSLGGVFLGQIAVVAFAVLAMTSEYSTRLIRTTFAANPRRGETLLAKGLIVSVVVFATGLVASVTSFLVGQSVLRGNGYVAPAYPPATLTDGPALRAVVGTALFLTALSLLGLGVGAIVRHTAGALSVVLALLFVPLMVTPLLPKDWQDRVYESTPVAGLAVQSTVERADNPPIGPGAGLAVTFTWAAAALLVGYVLLKHRDA